jgi:hypothetical protein
MVDIQYVDEDDIRNMVDDTCHFDIEDHGIGYYEMGAGTYNDINMKLSLTTQHLVVQYPIDNESMIYTLVTGTHYLTDGEGIDYDCDWIAELTHIEYNDRMSGFDATYEVTEE